MHEASLVADLVAKAEAVCGGALVEQVTVRRGALCHISAESLEEHFAAVVNGTLLEGAELVVVSGPEGDAALEDPYAQDLLLVSIDVAGGP